MRVRATVRVTPEIAVPVGVLGVMVMSYAVELARLYYKAGTLTTNVRAVVSTVT